MPQILKVKKNQLIVTVGGILLFSALFFFGRTVSNQKKKQSTAPTQQIAALNFPELLIKEKAKLSSVRLIYLNALESSLKNNSKEEQIHIYHQLANFWKDTVAVFEPYVFYTAEAAKLDNSEKSLTFAAQLFIDNLFDEADPAKQNWLATTGKVLLEKALAINPNNDSTKIGIGACYMLSNISENPMQGILEVKEIADKNPDNLYAQWVLALGGRKSGHYDKAAERFLIIVKKQPTNLIAILHLAECYELNNEKTEAIKWYKLVQTMVPSPEAKKEIQERIEQLQH